MVWFGEDYENCWTNWIGGVIEVHAGGLLMDELRLRIKLDCGGNTVPWMEPCTMDGTPYHGLNTVPWMEHRTIDGTLYRG